MSEEEKPSIHKLPLEIMGLILLELGNNSERRFEEIKKYRLIAPKWFSAVRVIFQDHFFHKCLTHFDGLENTYGESQRFAHNVFGSCKLNFSTLKISNSDYYPMNRWVNRLSSDNLQNLILKDNQLTLKELLRVLKKFSNIVYLEFIQSSRDIQKKSKIAEKMCQLYSNPNGKSDDETIEMIKKELVGTDDFLQNLKSINFQIIHASILNFLILIISCANCELEEISIEFDLTGIIFCCFWQYISVGKNRVNYENFEIGLMTQLNKFSKSLKKIKITAMPQFQMSPEYFYHNFVSHTHNIPTVNKLKGGISRLCQSIFTIFNGHHLTDLKNIEELQINILGDQFSSIKSGLLYFIKSRNNLSKVEVGVILESFVPVGLYGPYENQGYELELELKKNFLEGLTSLGVQFGYHATIFGLNPIVQFSENLCALEVDICQASNWRFSDYEVTFPNCKSLILRNLFDRIHGENRWSNFDVPGVVKKFQNLKSLEIDDQLSYWDLPSFSSFRPQINNEDLQIIIKNYPKLEKLSLNSCAHNLDDSGLTGLTSEALKVRINAPYLPVEPEERQGLPISHLKNLVELSLNKYNMYRRRDDRDLDRARITDLTPIYGFEYGCPLKHLSLYRTKITAAGAEILKRKLPLNCEFFVLSDHRNYSRLVPYNCN